MTSAVALCNSCLIIPGKTISLGVTIPNSSGNYVSGFQFSTVGYYRDWPLIAATVDCGAGVSWGFKFTVGTSLEYVGTGPGMFELPGVGGGGSLGNVVIPVQVKCSGGAVTVWEWIIANQCVGCSSEVKAPEPEAEAVWIEPEEIKKDDGIPERGPTPKIEKYFPSWWQN